VSGVGRIRRRRQRRRREHGGSGGGGVGGGGGELRHAIAVAARGPPVPLAAAATAAPPPAPLACVSEQTDGVGVPIGHVSDVSWTCPGPGRGRRGAEGGGGPVHPDEELGDLERRQDLAQLVHDRGGGADVLVDLQGVALITQEPPYSSADPWLKYLRAGPRLP